jgi:hypothetical protein
MRDEGMLVASRGAQEMGSRPKLSSIPIRIITIIRELFLFLERGVIYIL